MKKNNDSEHRLVLRLKKGDQRAVENWFKTYYQDLFRTANYKVKTKKDAEEIVQETFINCLKNLSTFKGNSSLLSWMKSILFHEIADYYRKLYAKKAIKTLPIGDLILKAHVADSHEVSNKVRQVLSTMVKDKQELLKLKYIDKKKVKEIADKFGKTFKSVESELYRARQEFKETYLNLAATKLQT